MNRSRIFTKLVLKLAFITTLSVKNAWCKMLVACWAVAALGVVSAVAAPTAPLAKALGDAKGSAASLSEAQTSFLSDLSALASFSSAFEQTSTSGKSVARSTGQFHFDKNRRFKLSYAHPDGDREAQGSSAERAPMTFTFDGKWLARWDADLGQTSFLHKNDFPLAFMVEGVEEVKKALRQGSMHIQQLPAGNGQRHYKISSEAMPDPLVIFIADGPDGSKSTHFKGWQLQHGDGAITFVHLIAPAMVGNFPKDFFSVGQR